MNPMLQAVAVSATVVFVCEHGSVKSVIASEWFDRLAAERGLAARALARGVKPETTVPPPIAERLRGDGFDVRGFQPRALAPADLQGASRVVTIGVEPPAWVARTGIPVDRWEGIPPATERYEAARDALRSRIAPLIDSLKAKAPRR